jgi:hypothetical protein
MAFTTWTALRTAIKDAIADQVAGAPCAGEYQIRGRKLVYRSYQELIDLLHKTYDLEALESAGETSTTISYGRPRRFR